MKPNWGASTGVERLKSAPELGAEKPERKEAKVAKHQELTPRHKLPSGHQPRRYSLVMRDKRQRRAKLVHWPGYLSQASPQQVADHLERIDLLAQDL